MTDADGVKDKSSLLRTSVDIASAYSRASLRAGDIVLSIGPSFGKVMIVPRYLEGANLTQGTARLAPGAGIDPRWLYWTLQSEQCRAFWRTVVSGGTFHALNLGPLGDTPIEAVELSDQRRIADFLDDRVSRIDQIISARRDQVSLIEEQIVMSSYDTVRGAHLTKRRESRLEWLGDLPVEWPDLTVGSQFQVDLGKMLDEKRQTGENPTPYLRNTNVQWDVVSTQDLKLMDIGPAERARYTVRPGDLLICEGGQPGRAAIWTGDLAPLGYQKALHRARSRGRSTAAWLLECLRVAVHMRVFAVDNRHTTIAHLTNDQVRSLRFPFPETKSQEILTTELGVRHASLREGVASLHKSIELLTEYRHSLITAAVTGDLDVTTAGKGIPG